MTALPSQPIVVVAGVIRRDGRWLITRRAKDSHLGGKWEFPGGKVDPGESHESALKRELSEELGVDAAIGREIEVVEHVYPERHVRLHFHECDFAGDPEPLLGQEMRWISRAELLSLDFPEADQGLIRKLTSTQDF